MTSKTKIREQQAPQVDSVLKYAEQVAQAFEGKERKRCFWNSLYYQFQKRLPNLKQRNSELRYARAIVWAAANAPELAPMFTPAMLGDLCCLFGGAEVEDINALKADPATFFAQASEWAKTRRAALDREIAEEAARD